MRAMFLGVEFLFRRGIERRNPNPASGIAAGILKLANILGEFRLAGTRRGIVERKNIIQDTRVSSSRQEQIQWRKPHLR